jgi:UTP--glucose-1-phosphate uridylyltransferase
MIDTAVIPAAGRGSRMMPLTTAIPKEMFPVGRLPMIEHSIIELVSSGIKRICIIIREGKEVIKEYFSFRMELYKEIELYFTCQKTPLGLGDAVIKAKDFIGDQPFVMVIPDQILVSEYPATRQLLDASKAADGIWNSMVAVPGDEIKFFKGSRPFKYRSGTDEFYIIEDILTEEASTIRGFGRTVFLPEALEYMTEKYINEETKEVDFLNTFKALKDRIPLYGTILKGKPCDLGTWEGYYHYHRSIIEYAVSEGTY